MQKGQDSETMNRRLPGWLGLLSSRLGGMSKIYPRLRLGGEGGGISAGLVKQGKRRRSSQTHAGTSSSSF